MIAPDRSPTLHVWSETADELFPIVYVLQLGRDHVRSPRARDVRLLVRDGGAWECHGSRSARDRRLGSIMLPAWTGSGRLAPGVTPRELRAHLERELLAWLRIGLVPAWATEPDEELVAWHEPEGGAA